MKTKNKKAQTPKQTKAKKAQQSQGILHQFAKIIAEVDKCMVISKSSVDAAEVIKARRCLHTIGKTTRRQMREEKMLYQKRVAAGKPRRRRALVVVRDCFGAPWVV